MYDQYSQSQLKYVVLFDSPEFGNEEELKNVFSWKASVEQYTSDGGTSRAAVEQQLNQLRTWFRSCSKP